MRVFTLTDPVVRSIRSAPGGRPHAPRAEGDDLADRAQIRAALTAWRAAEDRLGDAADGETYALVREVARLREEFQRLSSELVVEQTSHDAMRAFRFMAPSARLRWPHRAVRSDDER